MGLDPSPPKDKVKVNFDYTSFGNSGQLSIAGLSGMGRNLKVSVERKTFWVSLEGEIGGRWCSITEHSKGSVFVLCFEKEEVS